MQSAQLFPFVIVIGIVAISLVMRSRMRASAAAIYGGAMDALRAELASGQRADEGAPIIVVATDRKLLSARIYYVAVTNRRVVLKQAGGDTRAFERAAVELAIRAKTFTDVGNMQTTISRGWELRIGLPDGTRGAWRVYDHAEGLPDHAAHVQALVASLSPA